MSLLTFAYNVRYAYPWWKEKIINSDLKRKDGLCPLTPEETALILRALDIDQSIQIYIAAGEIYGGDRRMSSLAASYPNLVSTYCKKYCIISPQSSYSQLALPVYPFLTGQKGNSVEFFRP